MQTKIRVGAVSYLNTKPLIYGFEHGMMKDQVELKIDFPSNIAAMLLEDEIDVGLVPVAIIPQMSEHHIISDYCISCDGEVASVCLFSEVPLNRIEKILLDNQSRTSVELLKILVREYWKIKPLLEKTSGEYQSKISGTTAALVIGDRALEQRKISPYIYDLGLEWKKFTGLPFVFAAWISNKKLDEGFINSFNNANAFGLKKLQQVVEENETNVFNLHEYYTRYISFKMNEEKNKGMNLFLMSEAKNV
ncbi:MAG: menaquinone biosynthesis protein [Ginsengibacter sp.]